MECAIILAGQNEQSEQENRKASVAGTPDIYGGFVFGPFRFEDGASEAPR